MAKIIESLFEAESSELEKIVNSVLTRPNKKYEEQLNKIANKVDSFVAVKPKDGPKGEKGDTGPKGDKGDKGLDGKDGRDGRDGNNGKDGLDGERGQDGVSVSSVDVTFDNHLVVTLSDGNEIDAGKIDVGEVNLQQVIQQSGDGGGGGEVGPAGPQGLSAYEVAVENGFEGTEEEWLDSLQGIQGEQGPPGTDAEVTSENIIAALGYTPADEAVLGDIEAALIAINGEE